MTSLQAEKEGNLVSTVIERQAEFIYDSARLAAIAAMAPIIPISWREREQAFKDQFLTVISQQCSETRITSPEELHKNWVLAYEKMGWAYGECHDRAKKTHPDMVEYGQLGQREQDKDGVFAALCEIARLWIRE